MVSIMDLIHRFCNYYNWTFTLADPRTKDYPLMSSILPTLFFTLAYLAIVRVGPQLMQNRRPFKLKWAMIMYNLAMAALNYRICSTLLTSTIKLNYNYICEASSPSRTSPDELKIVDAIWWFYFSKLLEFSDTFFFILRKKHDQLSFLHVYHHSTMFPLWWIGSKWVPSGSTFLPAMVNSGIHVLMYSYYGLAAMGPGVAKFLWWKKYLTIIQMIQFTVGLALGINAIRINCDFPDWMHYTLVFYMLSFVVLFGKFYIKAYIEKRKQTRSGGKKNL